MPKSACNSTCIDSSTIKRLYCSQQRLLKQRQRLLEQERSVELERLRLMKHATMTVVPNQLRKEQRIVIIDSLDAIPQDYITVLKQPIVDRKAIFNDLKHGKSVPGAHLATAAMAVLFDNEEHAHE